MHSAQCRMFALIRVSSLIFCLSRFVCLVSVSLQDWSGELRLVGGSGPHEGRLEVKVGDTWGTVCDASWDSSDSKVVCRQLGFITNHALGLGGAIFGQGTGTIVQDDVRCTGTELSLGMCEFDENRFKCDHSKDVSVICNWSAELRLVGGSGPHEGRVEVKVGDNWGTICDDSWDNNDAEVVCRQLGFSTNRSLSLGHASFGQGTGSIIMDYVYCTGTELSLAMCNYDATTHCDHDKDASVICNWSADLRLVGGSGPHEGRVEVKIGDNWGTICHYAWDNKDAEVVCRQLGFSTNGSLSIGNAAFGQGTGTIVMGFVDCKGTELSLEMCRFESDQPCDHRIDASVICNWSSELRLVGGSGPHEGRIEVKWGDNWGTICNYEWDNRDAEVVCRQLGFTTNGSLSFGSALFGQGTGTIVMGFVKCKGNELSLEMCTFDTDINCGHRHDVSVICNWSAELRLVGGSGPHEGRVEVKVGDNWGTICDNSWDDKDAVVVCRQLGFTSNGSLSFGSAIFGPGTGTIVMDHVNCTGTELSLEMCRYDAALFCDHSNDVSVICSVPHFSTTVTVSYIVENMNKKSKQHKIRFSCDISDTDPDLFYRTDWYVNGVNIGQSVLTAFEDPDKARSLADEMLKDAGITSLGFHIYCEIRASYNLEGPSSLPSKSNPVFMGIKIKYYGLIVALNIDTVIPVVESDGEVTYPLPTTLRKRSNSDTTTDEVITCYRMSVSNNGVDYTEDLIMVITNSECMNCNKSGEYIQCTFSQHFCIVNNKCFNDGSICSLNPQYICRANTGTKFWEKQVPPSIESGETDVTLNEGYPVLFECKTSGNPSPLVVWKKENIILDVSGDLRYTFNGTGSLIIDSATLMDAGKYTCLATNMDGWSTSVDFSLTFRDKVDIKHTTSTMIPIMTSMSVCVILCVILVCVGIIVCKRKRSASRSMEFTKEEKPHPHLDIDRYLYPISDSDHN